MPGDCERRVSEVVLVRYIITIPQLFTIIFECTVYIT